MEAIWSPVAVVAVLWWLRGEREEWNNSRGQQTILLTLGHPSDKTQTVAFLVIDPI